MRMAPMSEAKRQANKKWNDANLKEKYDRIQLVVARGQKEVIQAAADAVGQSLSAYIKQAIQERMERERAGQPDTPQEPPQSPTGAATTPEGTTPPQEPEPPQERTEATGGWLQETGAGAVGGSVQVAPSPTQPTQKQPSEYTLSDFEAMDDAAFQRFVDMSSGEFGKYLSGISWADRVHVIGRRERAQNKERQQRQREIEY